MSKCNEVIWIVGSLWGYKRPSCIGFNIVKTVLSSGYKYIPESIMDSSLSVFAVSNMGRMVKLTILRSFRAVLWTDEQALLASNRLNCCWTVFRESYMPVIFDPEREKA